MTEILWHGRGGEGAFTAARLLGASYINKSENRFALAFPSFGPERRGAPIQAFTKLDVKPIGNRSETQKADYVIFLDDTLFSETAFSELKVGGKILINTKRKFDDSRILALDGDAIANEILKRTITNTVMLGAFSAIFKEIGTDDIAAAIKSEMSQKLWEKNIAAVCAAARAMKGAIQ